MCVSFQFTGSQVIPHHCRAGDAKVLIRRVWAKPLWMRHRQGLMAIFSMGNWRFFHIGIFGSQQCQHLDLDKRHGVIDVDHG